MRSSPLRCRGAPAKALGAGLACAALAAACRSHPSLGPLSPRPVRELDTWQVLRADRPVGRVVLIEIDDPDGAVRLYRAENTAGQWLGYLEPIAIPGARQGSIAGRVYKRVPFRDVEQFLGIYTIEECLPLLLEISGPIRLQPGEPASAAESSAGRQNG